MLNGILKNIDETFDGHTVDGICEGTYRMKDGSMKPDKSFKIWVAIDPERVDELKKLASQFARILKRESFYFEITDAEVEFIQP